MKEVFSPIGRKLEENKSKIAHVVLENHFEVSPAFKQSYTPRNIKLYLQDCEYKLSYLAEAVRLSQPELFIEYMRWAKIFFSPLNIVNDEFYQFFDLLRDNLKKFLSEEEFLVTATVFDQGVAAFRENSPAD